VLRPFNRMRLRRHDAEYPPADAPELTSDDVRDDLGDARAMLALAVRILDEMSPY
jgi:hypothetical protein